MSVEFSDDLNEKANDNVLLIGSGASKDFGGLLIKEIWDRIYNHALASHNIKKILRDKDNYEEAFARLSDDKEKSNFIKILKSIFKDFDAIMSSKPYEELNKFIKLFRIEQKYNFIFTTNQDLLIERCFLKNGLNLQSHFETSDERKNNIEKILPLNFPYIDYNLSDVIVKKGDSCVQSHNYEFEYFVKTIKVLEHSNIQLDDINFVKLHGSFNWDHTDGDIVQITGEDKISNIEKQKILNYSAQLFKKILSKKKRIIIVGYGFSDPHINDCLLNAVEHESDLVIINNLFWKEFKRDKLKFSGEDLEAKTNKIYNAISKYYRLKFEELLENEKRKDLEKTLILPL